MSIPDSLDDRPQHISGQPTLMWAMNIHTLGGLAGLKARKSQPKRPFARFIILLKVSGHGDRVTCAWKQESGWFCATDVAAAVASAAAGFLQLI